MGVFVLPVGVGDDDLGPLPPDDGHQAPDRLVQRRLGEAVGTGVGLGVGHARVPVAQHDGVVVANDVGGRLELGHPDPPDVGPDLGGVHGRVEVVPLLASGAAHQHRVHALGVVTGHRAGPLGGFIVRVGVHGEQAGTVRHGADLSGAGAGGGG